MNLVRPEPRKGLDAARPRGKPPATVQRATSVVFLLLLAASACGGSSTTAGKPKAASPSPIPSTASPSPVGTPNPAEVIFKRSEAVMVTVAYTVHRE